MNPMNFLLPSCPPLVIFKEQRLQPSSSDKESTQEWLAGLRQCWEGVPQFVVSFGSHSQALLTFVGLGVSFGCAYCHGIVMSQQGQDQKSSAWSRGHSEWVCAVMHLSSWTPSILRGHCAVLQRWSQPFTPLCVPVICSRTFQLSPSRGEVYFPSSWFWVHPVTSFGW